MTIVTGGSCNGGGGIGGYGSSGGSSACNTYGCNTGIGTGSVCPYQATGVIPTPNNPGYTPSLTDFAVGGVAIQCPSLSGI